MEKDFLDILKDKTIFYDCEFYYDDAAKEIASHITEFFTDLMKYNTFDWDWGKDITKGEIHYFLEGNEVTFNDIYQHWKDNIKK